MAASRPADPYLLGALGVSALLHLGVLVGLKIPIPSGGNEERHADKRGTITARLTSNYQASNQASIPLAHTPPPSTASSATHPIDDVPAPVSLLNSSPTLTAPSDDETKELKNRELNTRELNTREEEKLASSPFSDTPFAELSTTSLTRVEQSQNLNQTTYYSADLLDSPPRLRENVQLTYPPRARAAEVEGLVTLVLLINERGEVDDISVTQDQPPGYFGEAALTMLSQHRFIPARKQNQAVKSRWLTTVRYRLQDNAR